MDHYERQLRRALRWYPRHYRERHGEEIVATALELRELDELTVSKGERRGLMWGGLVTRARERPPLWHWFMYRSFNTRVPFRYRMWVRDDVQGRFYWARSAGFSVAFYLAVILPVYSVANAPEGLWEMLTTPLGTGTVTNGMMIGFCGVIVVLMTLACLRYYGNKALRRHDFHRDGTPVRWNPAHGHQDSGHRLAQD